jgi:NAD(P)-dependent dehydrogenase (short-subunit alcohol dehydrogenase family)
MTIGSAVVVVTGASRGLGLGVACLLAARGVSLLLTSRRGEELERVAKTLGEGARVATQACDVSDEQGMRAAFDRAATLGSIEGVLNNAGVLEPIGPVRDADTAAFDRHLRTNVTGVLVGTKLALGTRTAGRPLRIVNVSSGAASHGYRGWAAYCSSKAAVNMLTQVTSEEAHDDATSVVAVAPGVIETRMQRVIRETPAEQFPDVRRFVQMKTTGALLSAVDAAIALDWLLTAAPMNLSGQFVDARSKDMQSLVGAFIADGAEEYEQATARAKGWFESLEEE